MGDFCPENSLEKFVSTSPLSSGNLNVKGSALLVGFAGCLKASSQPFGESQFF
jgi:hypothetical protein